MLWHGADGLCPSSRGFLVQKEPPQPQQTWHELRAAAVELVLSVRGAADAGDKAEFCRHGRAEREVAHMGPKKSRAR
jgi:hypothetical protein